MNTTLRYVLGALLLVGVALVPTRQAPGVVDPGAPYYEQEAAVLGLRNQSTAPAPDADGSVPHTDPEALAAR